MLLDRRRAVGPAMAGTAGRRGPEHHGWLNLALGAENDRFGSFDSPSTIPMGPIGIFYPEHIARYGMFRHPSVM